MQVIENQRSGTTHLPGDEHTTLCGESLIVGCSENAHFREDTWLDEFPEDFGDNINDCARCAAIFHD